MGFFDRFKTTVTCPQCRTPGAQKFFSKITCVNPDCPRYNADYAAQAGRSMPPPAVPLAIPTGSFDAGEFKSVIHYRNFQGLDRDYTVDHRTIRASGQHLSFRAEPTGERINFDRRFIQNLSELLPFLGQFPEPTGNEKQILGYHKKYGTTSPRYEEIRQKFPGW